jgi:hypothetical protein
MHRKEALEFLELPDSASPEEIKERLDSKLEYFELLCEKAPSAFVQRLHARNVAKIKEIMVLSKDWVAAEPVVKVEVPVVTPAVVPEVKVSEPVVVKTPETVAKVVEPVVTPEPVVKESEPVEPEAAKPLAWLIRHTENQSETPYPIFAGKNYIGRKEKPGLNPFLKVEDDPYISKVHAVIIAEPGQAASFFVADDPADNGDRASTNGTYLNGKEERVRAKTPIRNNDTLQLGITKLIFRYNDAALETIVKEVADKGYMHTVAIDAS